MGFCGLIISFITHDFISNIKINIHTSRRIIGQFRCHNII